MTIKNILVHVDNSRGCTARLEAAFDLARSYGAHLTGLYVNPGTELPTVIQAPAGAKLIEEMEDWLRTQATQAETMFNQIAAQNNMNAEWRYVEGNAADTLNLHAHYVDIVIVGQGEGNDPRPVTGGTAVKVLLESGRPVLINPYASQSKPIGERVMVAWNVRREAVRAINDALPILERAKQVDVVAVNPPLGESGEGDIPAADICLHLARHGVKAEALHLRAEDIKVGDMLLSHATEQGLDLIVMGGYGHSRWREIILGGVTKYLLDHMTVPILMSH